MRVVVSILDTAVIYRFCELGLSLG